MARMRTPVLLAAASLALAAPAAEDGACATNFDFKLKVKDGKVTYAGSWPVTATGGISKVGAVNLTLSHGHQKVAARGLVEGDAASGHGTSPKPKGSGSWFARRA